ncbi:MAG: phage portal protein, partial [Novosphingobium sp.]|nr:phage portal protein [Novosphingobium sp.]
MSALATFRSRLSGWISPGNNTRDAARNDLTEFSGWRPGMRFAGSTNYGERDTIMGRARDLDENNGWINGGLDRRVESVIGVNIRLSAQPKYTMLNRDHDWRMQWAGKVQDRFTVWSNDIHRRCDARMKLTLGGLSRLAYLTYVRDGEMAAEIRDIDRGLTNPTSVMLIEPERISTPDWLTESKNLRNGIVFD